MPAPNRTRHPTALLFVLIMMAQVGGCALEDVDLAGRPCPCVDPYACDPSTSTCQLASLGVAPGDGDSSGDGDGDGDGAVSGGGDVGGGDVGGDGDVSGDGDATSFPPLVRDSGVTMLPDGAVTMPTLECPTLPPPGACPPECSNCDNGVCTFTCLIPGVQCTLPQVCPPGWPCLMDCAGTAGGCNAGSLICADGPCQVNCNISTCMGLTVKCGTGPDRRAHV